MNSNCGWREDEKKCDMTSYDELKTEFKNYETNNKKYIQGQIKGKEVVERVEAEFV